MANTRFDLFLAQDAKEDLAKIAILSAEEWSKATARNYMAALDRALENLTSYPSIGRALGGSAGGLRSLGVSSHVIFYRVDEASRVISVARILHVRMDAEHHLELS